MTEWWKSLDPVNQWFYVAAMFFGVFFLWQLVAALIGLGGGEDADADGGDFDAADHPEFEHGSAVDAHETVAAFKMLSIRSILAFCTLFTWAVAMYLDIGTKLTRALAYGLGWGLIGMIAVSLIFFMMRRLTESGNPRLASSVGTRGRVYMDIPPAGEGEVRVTVSGVLSHVRARVKGGAPLQAGSRIRVVRLLDSSTIEVAPVEGEQEQQKGQIQS